MQKKRQPTQEQMFYQEQAKIGRQDELFMQLVREGMTREELQKNIQRRPSLWGKYSNFLPNLPSKHDKAQPAQPLHS